MHKVLFFNPPFRKEIYSSTNTRVGAPDYPNLTLATLAGNLINDNAVKIIDLDLAPDYDKILFDEIESFRPDIVAATVITPDYFIVRDIMNRVKSRYGSIVTVVGGVHVTSLPEEASMEKCFDHIVLGEGDTVIGDLMAGSFKNAPGAIPGERIFGSDRIIGNRELIPDLNGLPYPAWHLFELDKYKNSRLSSRVNPVGLLETSRGCAFQCVFCNKLIFGGGFRAKGPERVVDEMEYMLRCGFREIHVMDDSFTQDIGRAKEICAEIIRRRLKFPWSSISGVRVDTVDREFFELAKRSGCWQVGFGIESGDQEVLDRINKRTTLSQAENAVRLAGKAGLSTFGFFILALPGETESSMTRTIEFSKKLPLDIAKFDICIPYPGTSFYKELKSEGRILSEDWPKYNCHQIDEPLFGHPGLSWDVIRRYYKKAFREFYLRPGYIARRLLRSLRMGDVLYDIRYFAGTKW